MVRDQLHRRSATTLGGKLIADGSGMFTQAVPKNKVFRNENEYHGPADEKEGVKRLDGPNQAKRDRGPT